MAERPVEVFLASRNAKKLAEMERILAEHLPGVGLLGLDDVTPYDEPVEDQPTFEGNALLKARAGHDATGLPAAGRRQRAVRGRAQRDAGGALGPLVGTAQGRRPQQPAAPGPAADVPDERRGAYFACAVALVHRGGQLVVEGRMPGRVVREVRGTGGFGYDVLFEADERPGVTTAELDRAAKDAISHRGHALRELGPLLAAELRR